MGGQPLFILEEDTERTQGKDAQSSNISAGKAVSEAVRTTLGPRGMDKMLVSDDGDVVITNDGATILGEMDIEHPAAQMIVEVAESQEEDVGDGTTTASVLAGELLSKAESLLDDDVHPTTIVEGYHEASQLAQEAIDEQVIATDLDDDQLLQVAKSSMTGKGTGDIAGDVLAEVVVDAVRAVQGEDGVDRDAIALQTQIGAASSATELIEGVIVDEEPAHENMPRTVEDGAVAIIDGAIELQESNVDAEYNVTNVDQLNAALDAEEKELRGYAEALADLGAEIVFTTDDIDDRVQAYLAKEGILAFEDLSSDDLASIRSASGATRVSGVNALEDDDLGTASVSVRIYGEDELAFIEGPEAETVTVFARGSTEHVLDEVERSLMDALDVVTAALDKGGVVPGAGATEIAIAAHLRDHAASIEGRKQLAVEAFADAVDVLPRTLAENTGMDPIDALVDLRAAYDGGDLAGIISEGQTGTVTDPLEYGVLDPAAVKHEAVHSATEAATMIVRIDDVIASS
ncbi:thermosome subunit alpha [Halapricum hydrolyticum]|uniref:Thermosome subunit alpha n=1 Tax=Halapricum hydrolyticum TaxID=2979991 RepID=A0AAE3IFS3_9EURY|nr:thermosome subunit alpha [Halapricum hydrolyticum]MCU4718818.1 thermosome subunit alpha [Halapricum hydrolyticum]MCU4727774.1 thermosome subunit alpha [Halapricum hydrolyticum]